MSKKDIKKIFGLFIFQVFFLLIVSFIAPRFLEYKASFPYFDSILPNSHLPKFIYSFANFDGVHYLTIVEKGYKGTGLIQAFFPLYPVLIKLISVILRNQLLSGLLLSYGSFFLAMVFWFKLVKSEFNKKFALLSILVILSFPTSFYFFSLYTESLFLLLVVLSFYFAKKDKWFLASIAVALASATRLVGIFLVPALIIEAFQRSKTKDQRLKKTTIILTGSTGLLVYMAYLWFDFADPLYFLHVQSEFGAGRQENLVLLPQVIYRYIKILITYRPIGLKYYSFVQDLFVFFLSLVSSLLSYKFIKNSYLLFALCALILPTLTGTFSSMPRYVLVCFPIYLFIAKLLTDYPKLRWVYFPVSTFFLIFNTILFIQGYWIA